MRRAPGIGLIALLGLMGGCVADGQEAGLRYQGRRVGGGAPPGAAGPAAEIPALPLGPVAMPVLDSTFSASMRAQVVPLGGVEYDGQTLPLVSPDGRFLASEAGLAPTWPTLLGTPGATVPLSTRLVVYDASEGPARPVAFTPPLPEGLVLGRAADDWGFLVEAPQPDGSRWIGRVQWATGSLEWLVRNGRVNAHAVYTPAGSLAYVSRDVGAGVGGLVLRATDGTESVGSGDGSAQLFPVASPEPGIVCSLARTEAGLEIQAWSLDTGGWPGSSGGGPERLGSIIARAVVCQGDEAVAYQIVAPAPMVLPRRADAPWRGERPAIFHPGFGRMAEFDRSTGGFVVLPEGSIAAARAPGTGADGWFVTTPEGLLFTPDQARAPRRPGGRVTVQNARVDPQPYVPRQTAGPDRPLILLGPVSRRPDLLQVVSLRFAAGAPGGP